MTAISYTPRQTMSIRFPVRRYLQTSEKIQAPGSRWGRLQWVLSRSLLRFHTIDLANVPAKSRAQSLQLELIQWTPFARSEYYIGWIGEQALVWAWDAERIGADLAKHQQNAARVEVIPEPLLRTPHKDGLILLQCLDGFEAQVWQRGLLLHSRWWPQTPHAEEWLMFQRDAAVAPSQQQMSVAHAQSTGLADQAWLANSAAGDPATRDAERMVIAATALALFGATCWYGASWYKVRGQMDMLNQQKAQLQSQATPIAQARGQALDDLQRIQSLQTLSQYPGQLSLMAKIGQNLPQDKSSLKDWDFQNGQLKFTVNAPADIAASALIAKFQQDTLLREVKALPSRDQKNVTFQADVQKD